MSWEANGGYWGPRPAGPSPTEASGWWRSRAQFQYRRDNVWPRQPDAPTNLAASPGGTDVVLTWSAPPATYGTVTDYAVEYTPAGGSPTVTLTGSTAESYTVTGLTIDTEYTFRVAAVTYTQGPWSAPISAMTQAGWDVSTATYLRSASVSTATLAAGLFFRSDGLKMYVLGDTNSKVVAEYNLGTAWNVSTAAYVQNVSIATQESSPTDLFFKSDGLKMYVLGAGGDDVDEYELGTAWDVSTATYAQRFSIAAQEIFSRGLFFRSDGLKMYVCGGQGDDVNEYDLGTAWDVSTAAYVRNFVVAGQETIPAALHFSPDGLKMFVMGIAGDDVNEYDLGTAWNVSTAAYVQNFSVAAQETNPRGLFFKPDGTRMYVAGDTNTVYEYVLSGLPALASLPVSSGLILRVNAAAADTVFDSDSGGSPVAAGGSVGRIEDLSGNGYHAVQPTSANRPTLQALSFAGGRYALDFSGSTGHRLYNTNFTALGTGDYTVLTVIAVPSTSTPSQATAAAVGYNPDLNRGLLWSTVSGWTSRPARNGAAIMTTTAPILNANALYVFAGVRSGNTFSHRINGAATTPATATVSHDIVSGYTLGATFASGIWTQAWSGWVAEHIVYNRALSAEELEDVESHIMSFWAIT